MLDALCRQKVVVANQMRHARTTFQNDRLYRVCVTYDPAAFEYSKRLCCWYTDIATVSYSFPMCIKPGKLLSSLFW